MFARVGAHTQNILILNIKIAQVLSQQHFINKSCKTDIQQTEHFWLDLQNMELRDFFICGDIKQI